MHCPIPSPPPWAKAQCCPHRLMHPASSSPTHVLPTLLRTLAHHILVFYAVLVQVQLS